MVDKIEQFGSLANNNKSDRIQKKIRSKKIAKEKLPLSKNAPASEKGDSGAKVEISQAAKEQLLLRAQAERYLKLVEQQEGISPDKVDSLKQKIADNFYLKEKVIDKIVDKLLDLPGFSDKRK